MIIIKAYLYPNNIEVQVFDPTIFTVRNRVVYSRPIKVYQGIDNPVQIIVRNQDQRPVDLTGYNVLAEIQDPVNQVMVAYYPVTFTDITKGLGNFTIDQNTINSLEQRFYKITVKTIRVSDDTTTPLYIDDNYGVPLDLEVLPAYYTASGNVHPGGINLGNNDYGTI